MPPDTNKWSRRLRTAWRLFRGLFHDARPPGLAALEARLRDSPSEGSGLRGFLLWGRDAAAFEQRGSARAYQRWIARRAAPAGAAQQGTETRVARCAGWGAVDEYDKPYVLFDHPDAVVGAVAAGAMLSAAEVSGADVVYADEDQLGAEGRHSPSFKPGFSIDLLRVDDYIGPVFLVRSAALARLAERLPGAEVSGSHELLLRLAEAGARFEHVSEPLVHWRRPRAHDSITPEVLQGHLARCYGEQLGGALSRQRLGGDAERVSIIIPTRDRHELLAACIESIYGADAGLPFEIILVDNDSRAPDARAWLEAAPDRYANLRVVSANYAFNWSKLNNQASRLAGGNYLLYLNNDVEVASERWLELLTLQAMRPDIGAVGPLLRYPDGTIQHAGVVVGLGGFADHVYSGCDPAAELHHPFVHPRLPRNVLAVTGACLMISRADYELVGGFDEDLAICGDIDICLRLHRSGRLNLYDPRVQLLHHESATRLRRPVDPEEVRRARRRLTEFLESGDPYYNSALCLQQRYPGIAI